MVKTLLLTLLLLPLLITGCTTPKYACGVPDGIGCKPLSEVHRMAQDGTLKMRAAPSNRDEDQSKETASAHSDVEKLAGRDNAKPDDATKPDIEAPPRTLPEVVTVTPGAPILTPPRTLRVWIARWPDEDGTLHDETYLYLRLDNGRWLME
jgi:conjugal transfer pilus assembly protein TraV